MGWMFGQDTNFGWLPIRVDKSGAVVTAQDTQANSWTYAAASGGITDTSDVTLAAAAGVGLSNFLTGIQIMNKSAVATEVVVKDGSTIIWRGYSPASGVGPLSITFEDPLQSSPNTALKFAAITTSSAIYVNAQGHADVLGLIAAAANTNVSYLLDDNGNTILDDSNIPIVVTTIFAA